MATVYKITNQINGKMYIGKTEVGIDERWRTHKRDARTGRESCPVLYDAMRKYGIENFKIEPIEECSIEELPEREIYWIKFYNTFKGDGYNASAGGDGRKLLDKDLIVEKYKELGSIRAVCDEIKHDRKAITKILREEGFDTSKVKRGKDRQPRKKPVSSLNIDKDLVIERYKELNSVERVAQELGHNKTLIADIIKEKTGKTPFETQREKI